MHESILPHRVMMYLAAHDLAQWQGWEIFPRPFNGSIKDTWKALDEFNIDEAVIYSDSSIETWVRHPNHWDVAITNFTFK